MKFINVRQELKLFQQQQQSVAQLPPLSRQQQEHEEAKVNLSPFM